MSVNTAAIQQLYVAYFNRPADPAGLAFWEKAVADAKGSTAAVSAAFAGSAEYKATFAGLDEGHIVAQIYQNLFNRLPDVGGLNFWTQRLLNKDVTIDNVVATIANAAGPGDKDIIINKVAAAKAFTEALDTPEEILGYGGPQASAAAKTWLSSIGDGASLTVAIDKIALDKTVAIVTKPYVAPMTLSLTANIDTATGGAGDDIINATTSTGANALTTFDSIDGGAGTDTIRFVDTASAGGTFSLPMGATVKNIELVNVQTLGAVNMDTTAWSGVTGVTVAATGAAANTLIVANTTDVNLTSATTNTTGISGGKAVSVALAAGAGTVGVTGAGLTTVSVKGGNGITIDNFGTDTAATTAKGTTLTAVTLEGIAGGATVSGASLTNVSLKSIAAASTVTVNNGTASHALNITADAAGKVSATAPAVVTVADAIATSVNVAANGVSNLALNAAKATKLAVTGAKAVTLDLTAAVKVASIDASADVGGVTLTGISSLATSITTGTGNDKFTVTAATAADVSTTTANETISASVSTGAGNDTVTIATSGDGKLTVDTGTGNDTVNIAAHGTTVLNISLGDGNDTLTATAAINATDVIDAGAGTDTLALQLVGSANIGAFSGFDLFDAAGLGKALDVDILATKNTVSEIVASGDVLGGASLLNVGAGVGVRVTGDMAASNLSITQKTAGALTVTVDADETGDATDTADHRDAAVTAENATSVKAVFDTSYLASNTAEKVAAVAAADNITTLDLTGNAATSLEIVSGGELSKNVLIYSDVNDKLDSITVSGAQHLDLTVGSGSLMTVNSSAATGGLTFNTDSLGDGGKVILGSGVDTITVGGASVAGGIESIQGFETTAKVAVSTDAADATALAAAWADADSLFMGGVNVADATHAGLTAGVLTKGVLTFTGAGPATLADAILIADTAADAVNEAVEFQYLGDSYVFVQAGATGDAIVKLVGVTGITNFAEGTGTSADHFILV